MAANILMGFRDVSLAAVTRDDTEGYACADAVALPSAVKLRRSWLEMCRATFSDHGARERVRVQAGIEAELRLAGADPVLLAELGLWKRGGYSDVFGDGLPRGGKGYSLRFVADSLDGAALCCKYRVFWVEDIRLDDCASRGVAQGVCEWIITGTLRAPRCVKYQWWEALSLDGPDGEEERRRGFLMGGE